MASRVTLGTELMFPSEYLSAVEFRGKEYTLTIKSVSKEDLQMKGGKKEKKPVVFFMETPKKLVLNKTNADSIASMYGTDALQWKGRRVTFYPTKVQCGRDVVDAIRTRETIPTPKGPSKQQEPDMSTDHNGGMTAEEIAEIEAQERAGN